MAETVVTDTDPRRSAAGLLEALRRGPMKRAALVATVGPAYTLLLRVLERDGHAFRYDRPRGGGDWWRVRLVYDAGDPALADATELPEQLGLDVGGSAPPRSALLGFEEAA